MSTSLLVAKERQPGSSFGLGQKQAKIKKYGANAPQLHAIRCSIDFYVMLCNETAFNPVQAWLSGLLLCAVPQQQLVRPQFITLRLLRCLEIRLP